MIKRKSSFFIIGILVALFFVSCSSQEYTTAKLAVQQSDFKKAAEWLPKAMAVEPDNPEIPLVLAVEIYAQNGQWKEFVEMFNKQELFNSVCDIIYYGYVDKLYTKVIKGYYDELEVDFHSGCDDKPPDYNSIDSFDS